MKPQKYLQKRGLSYTDLASEIGYDRSYLTNIFNGRVKVTNKFKQRFADFSDSQVLPHEWDNSSFISKISQRVKHFFSSK